jgi:sodium-coupled neutral amino acid transporter 7/8
MAPCHHNCRSTPPLAAALAGYLAFPVTARSNIILNFSQHDWLMQAARACIGLIQICAYPVNHHPARGAVLDFVRHTTGANLGGAVFHVIEPLLFYGATLTVALACSDLGELGVGGDESC